MVGIDDTIIEVHGHTKQGSGYGHSDVRRTPAPDPSKKEDQEPLFDTWRFLAFLTTTDSAVADTVPADKTTTPPPSSSRSTPT